MKKVVMVIVACALIAGGLSSCTSKNGILNPFRSSYQDGQTNPQTLIYMGTMQGQYLDHDMVPIQMCETPQIVWATFPDSLYKQAAFLNQDVAKGNTVEVTMIQVWSWARRGYVFQITSAQTINRTSAAAQSGAHTPTRTAVPQSAATATAVHSDVYVNVMGNVNAPITIVGNHSQVDVHADIAQPQYQTTTEMPQGSYDQPGGQVDTCATKKKTPTVYM